MLGDHIRTIKSVVLGVDSMLFGAGIFGGPHELILNVMQKSNR